MNPIKQAVRASVYRQAALARLAEAEYLKQAHPSGAIYLGGYVVECMLKWAICQRKGTIYLEDLPDQHLAERLTGARGHDLDFLLRVSGLRPLLESDDKLYIAFNQVSIWSVHLRYNPKAGDAQSAYLFLNSVHELRDWLESVC
ncbi:hypothetical protein L0337_23215 [candidate division KSB1 bacterium]|nr:hypothetical protein [candidate division KSB1 bacterium]